MYNKLRAIAMGILCLGAVFCAAFAVVEYGRAEAQELVSCVAVGNESNYVLRDYEGYVAVFVENDPSCPMTVTDIQVSTLRELDRNLLQTGMKVRTHERLMMTLEDLGS
ncbi:MAG: hypothetical protein RR147_00970 [Oscillospiraceae bacterium]